jgi:hypothetical protein
MATSLYLVHLMHQKLGKVLFLSNFKNKNKILQKIDIFDKKFVFSKKSVQQFLENRVIHGKHQIS